MDMSVKRYARTVLSLSLIYIFGAINIAHGDLKSLNKKILNKERQFKALKDDLEKWENDIEALKREERSLIDELHALDRRLKRKEDALGKITKKEREAEKDIALLQKEIVKFSYRRSQIEDALKIRLTIAYKMRQGGLIKILLTSRDLSVMRRRYKYLSSLMIYDLQLIERYNKNSLILSQEKRMLEEKKKELVALKAEKEKQKSAILNDVATKKALIRRIKRDKALSKTALRGLKEASLRLESKIKELRMKYAKAISGAGFAALKGSLTMPVEGEVISFYGKVVDPELKTITFNKGIEIEAPKGTKVKSIYKGRVVFSNWFKGYGKMIIIDNGGGYYTIFAHLSKMLRQVGDNVRKGEVIALVGDTGSLNGSRLYFEIRYRGVPRDPLEWIVLR